MINYQTELNDQQYPVVTQADGPALVLAGAGSGKTRTITYRVAYLLENGVPEDQILLVTFTNKAAREMMNRVEQLIGRPVKIWGGTFHSIALRILKTYATHLDYQNNFTVLDSDDAKSLIKLCIKEENISTTARRFPAAGVLNGIISYARNAQTTIADVLELKYPNFLPLLGEIQTVANKYEQKKHEANVMDFDDLLENLLRLLATKPKVRERLAQQFQYVLVDEYQDTNLLQAQIIRHLASAHNNILVVGDDAQSIYSFRAANIQNILEFEKDFPGAKVYRLETNYRSTPDILEVANTVIGYNRKQFKKNLQSVVEPHIKPHIVPAQTKKDEAAYIANRILELLDAGVQSNRIAVLFRAAYHSQALEFELAKRDIPYDFRGGVRFFERAHIKDVMAYLRIMANLDDQIAWMRVLAMQEGIGAATAQKILQKVRECSTIEQLLTLEGLPLSSRAKQGWYTFTQILDQMLTVPTRSASDLITAVAHSAQYKEYLESQHTDWRDRLEDLDQLALFAQNSENLDSFINEASLQEGFGSAAYQADAQPVPTESKIVLSTIHQAKGLEWDTVFVMHLLMPGFPNDRALKEPGGLEEERRLFYVAITRAQRKLYFTYPLSSNPHTMVLEQPSQFLDEIGAHLVQQGAVEGGGKTVWRSLSDLNDGDVHYESEEEGDWRGKSFLRNLDEL